jgi:hypothetical protein
LHIIFNFFFTATTTIKNTIIIGNNNNNNNKGLETTGEMYTHIHTHINTHTPKPLWEHEDYILLWNEGVQTEKLLIKTKRERTRILIHVAIPTDRKQNKTKTTKG